MEVEDIDEIDINQMKDKEIVIPGEVLSEDLTNFTPGRGTTKQGNKIISLFVGLK
ncbi:unnamed protein product, partial [marine sediment metagenome]